MDRTLTSVEAGETTFVLGISADEKVRIRLESMGIIPGTEVDVLTNNGGPIMLSIGEGRIVVERDVAENVIVA